VSSFLANILSGDVRAAERFLSAWYGPPTSSDIAPMHDAALPAALSRLYEAAARWAGAIAQNVLVPPERVDGRTRFCVENQGVYEWATDDAARVWGRELDAEDWASEEPDLATFVMQLLVFEATLGAGHRASIAWLPSDRVAEAVAPLEPLPGGWRWPSHPTRFYAGAERQLAVVAPNDDCFSVFIAAAESSGLAYLDNLVDDSWELFTRRDKPLGIASPL